MEYIRRNLRVLLGVNSRAYSAGACLLDWQATLRKEGIQTWRELRALGTAPRDKGLGRPVSLRGLSHPIYIRPGTLDASTVINNVIREEYGQFKPETEPEWMIDAGAYIGDTAAYFLSRFPSLKVIALEPNAENYEMVCRNLSPYGDRAVALKKGLYSEDGQVCFSGGSTAGSISREGDRIECVSLPSLLRHYAIPKLNILKMDIEGGEEAVFRANPESWLPRASRLIIEIHSASILDLISRVLNEQGFSMTAYRSVWYCRNKL